MRCAFYGGQGQASVELRETSATGNVLAPADDAIGKRDARFTACELTHFKAVSTFAMHVKAPAIALGRNEKL